MQYVKYANGQYSYRTDPVSGLKWRFGRRNDAFVNDYEIVVGGFALAETVGWINSSYSFAPIMWTHVRLGARGTNYVLDSEIMQPGFNGTENIHWENLLSL